MNIYIVCHCSGEYEDYSVTNVAAFSSKEVAEIHAVKLKNENDRMAAEGRVLQDVYDAWLELNPRPAFPYAKLPKYPHGVRKLDLPQSYLDAVKIAKDNQALEQERFEKEMTSWREKETSAIRTIIDSHTEFPEEDRLKFHLSSQHGYWRPDSVCDREDRFDVREVEFHG